VVRTSQPLKSVLQAYAILRSIESSYGQVINFDVSRDPDSLAPSNIIFFQMAEPVNLGKEGETLHEIPSPISSTGVMERYGGPSLNDIRNILSSNQLPMSTKGKQSQESITFRVEIRRKSGNPVPLPIKKTTPTTISQDKQLLEALGKFGDGFFGGFKGLHETHMGILEKKEQNTKATNEGRGRKDVRNSSRQATVDEAAPHNAEANEQEVEEKAQGVM